MCGIFGYVAENDLNDNEIIETLSRRGPDFQNKAKISISENSTLTLIHTRLSIIDTSSNANQPFWDPTGKFIIVFNGEIYNYLEIRKELVNLGFRFKTHSDTEVILNSYIFWGESCLSKFRGMFAFCIYDKIHNKLFLARDQFGIKPLYFVKTNRLFLFASTIQSIISSDCIKEFTLNENNIDAFLQTGSFIPPDTIFNEVKMLLPGQYLIFENELLTINNFFNFNTLFNKTQLTNRKQVTKLVRDSIIQSVEQHLIADVPIAILLSGGIDSTLITGISSKILRRKTSTFSIGYSNLENKLIDETEIATETARNYNTNHHNILLDYNDFMKNIDNFIDALDVPSIDGFNTFLIAEKISKYVKVALSGLGADELFAGYPVFKQLYFDENFNLSYYLLNNIYPLLKCKKQTSQISLFDTLMKRRTFLLPSEYTIELYRNNFIEGNQKLLSASIFEIRNYMSNTLLRDSDAIAMYHSLEIRVPFVDKDLLNVVSQIPDNYKISSKYNKPLLVDAFKDILPAVVYKRRKTGFSLPIPEWTDTYLRTTNYKIGLTKCNNILSNHKINYYTGYQIFGQFILEKWLTKYKNKISN